MQSPSLASAGTLECDGLSAARRHQPQGVFAFANAIDDVFLYAPEVIISPVLFEKLRVGS